MLQTLSICVFVANDFLNLAMSFKAWDDKIKVFVA